MARLRAQQQRAIDTRSKTDETRMRRWQARMHACMHAYHSRALLMIDTVIQSPSCTCNEHNSNHAE